MIGRRIGERVLVISTSTGGTLAAIAATDTALSKDLAGVIFVAPNFGLADPAAILLEMPLARWWAPLVAGRERVFTPQNEKQDRFWTMRYPTVALFAMTALVRQARARDFSTAKVPALFIYSEQDKVVSARRAAAVARAWGGPVRVEKRVMGPGDDPMSHVIAGDAFSPGQTEQTIDITLDWAREL